MNMNTETFQPEDVSNLDMAFGGKIENLLPPYNAIPEQFKNGVTEWNRFFSDMFFAGIKSLELTPREGIDQAKALRHIRTISASFEPKHEHKEAGVAYLMSLWFNPGGKWERAK